MSRKLKWFARGGDIAKCGPFDTQEKACAAMKLVKGGFPENCFVWCETVKTAKKETR